MFEDYSRRALHVVMLARIGAGRRGAAAIEIEDLIAAILAEDQAELPTAFGYVGKSPSTATPGPKRRFFSPDLSKQLLAKVEAICTQSQPIPNESDIPLSQSAKRALEAAARLREELRQPEVGPLHLLAAALTQDENKAIQILREAGITEEMVLEAARTGAG